MDWPRAEPIETQRLTLESLRVEHAGEMFEVLDDRRLYEYTGGAPPSPDDLHARYALQAAGHAPDRRHGWLNWIVRERDTGAAVGTVQATLRREDGGMEAEVAWIVGSSHQGRGYAKEAARAMAGWLESHGVDAIIAHIHPAHLASMGVARHLGLTATDVIDGGETRWVSAGPIAHSDS